MVVSDFIFGAFGAIDMTPPTTTNAFDLPDRLSSKADPDARLIRKGSG